MIWGAEEVKSFAGRMETHRHEHDGWHAKAKSEEEKLERLRQHWWSVAWCYRFVFSGSFSERALNLSEVWFFALLPPGMNVSLKDEITFPGFVST